MARSRPAKPNGPATDNGSRDQQPILLGQTTDPKCEQATESSSPSLHRGALAPRRTKHGSRPCSANHLITACRLDIDYNTRRLHASLGYVDTIRQARQDGLKQARLTRIAYHRNNKPNQPCPMQRQTPTNGHLLRSTSPHVTASWIQA